MKKWYQSSTIWINVVGILVLILEFVLTTNLIPDPEVIAVAVAVLNILNRFRAPKRVEQIEKTII
jgi:hypothetical protein